MICKDLESIWLFDQRQLHHAHAKISWWLRLGAYYLVILSPSFTNCYWFILIYQWPQTTLFWRPQKAIWTANLYVCVCVCVWCHHYSSPKNVQTSRTILSDFAPSIPPPISALTRGFLSMVGSRFIATYLHLDTHPIVDDFTKSRLRPWFKDWKYSLKS